MQCLYPIYTRILFLTPYECNASIRSIQQSIRYAKHLLQTLTTQYALQNTRSQPLHGLRNLLLTNATAYSLLITHSHTAPKFPCSLTRRHPHKRSVSPIHRTDQRKRLQTPNDVPELRAGKRMQNGVFFAEHAVDIVQGLDGRSRIL